MDDGFGWMIGMATAALDEWRLRGESGLIIIHILLEGGGDI